MDVPARFPTLMPWFRILRLPNLLTIPGDPIAGFLLASPSAPAFSRMMATAGASLFLYIFGLLLNDMVDLQEDMKERPERPLPSGAISFPQARMAAIAAALAGLNLASFAGKPALWAAVVLALLIVAYNAWLKKIPILGVLVMGACRGASLLLGAFAAKADLFLSLPDNLSSALPSLTGGVLVFLYVAGFSQIAKNETMTEKPMGFARWLPFSVLLAGFPILLLEVSRVIHPSPFTAPVLCFFLVMTLMRAWFLGGIQYRAQPVPETIGGHIRNLLMLQACLCATAGTIGLFPALTFVFLSLAFKNLSRRFACS